MNVDAQTHMDSLKLLNKHERAHAHYRRKADRLAKLCAVLMVMVVIALHL